MTDQLELPLEWRLLDVDKCPHKSLRYDGMLLEEVPIVTCYHPRQPHCGGSFDARKFTRNGAILHKGQMYCVDYLADWHK